MGTIINQKILPDGKVKVKVELDIKEALVLRGHVNNIHIFTKELSLIDSKVIEKGKRGATKYFFVPRKIREASKRVVREMSCQSFEDDTNAVFIYCIDKAQSLL
jgi:hypothetical protein